MIDIFTVVVPHALMAIAIWRLLARDDLDIDTDQPRIESGFGNRKTSHKAGLAARAEETPGA